MARHFFLAALLLWPAASGAAWNPPDWEKAPPRREEPPVSAVSTVLHGGLRFYQTALGPILGPRCPSQPSCSAFAVEAVRQEGPFFGSVLTAARLLSEGDEGGFSPFVFANGGWKIFDPPGREADLFLGRKGGGHR